MMCLLQLKQSIPVSIAIMSSLLQLKDCWDSNIAIETLLFMVPSIFLAVAIFLPEKENRVWHFKYIREARLPQVPQDPISTPKTSSHYSYMLIYGWPRRKMEPQQFKRVG